MKLVYVACAYTSKSEFEKKLNIEAARYAGYKIAKEGFYPVMPTVNTAGFDDAQDYDFWVEATLTLMKKCDAVYVVDGHKNSKGVRGEIELATELAIPIYYEINDLSIFEYRE